MAHTNTHPREPWPARFLRAIDERWWLRHGLFWLVRTVLLTWLVLCLIHVSLNLQLALRDMLLLMVPHMVATYALLYGVLPALWQGRRTRLVWLLAAWFPLSVALHHGFRHLVMVPLYVGVKTLVPDAHLALAPGPYVLLAVTAGVAACLHVYRQWRQRELANGQLRQENYRAELQLLKSQIHPHFLFNTLNNLYALTLRQSAQAPEVVDRLTGLLQFVVEQGHAALVPLPDEVALLRNYLALEHLRYGPRLTLDFRAEGLPATGGIAPLLLLPLVENAFKHGAAEQVGPAHITVVLGMAEDLFTCVITNSKNDAPPAAPPGIGLRNVRHRLQLLYPDRHCFETEARPDTYTVRLTLELAEVAAPVPQRAGRAATLIPTSAHSESLAFPSYS